MNYIPTIIENYNQSARAYDLISYLLDNRIIFLNGPIDDETSSIIILELLYLDAKDPNLPISLYINSPGGSIVSGMAIYDTMNYIHAPIDTICIGMCASMAAFLLSAGTKQRYALPNSEIMIHQPMGKYDGQASDIEISANRILKLKDKLNRILANNTKQDLDKIIKDTDRDYFMNANEALKYGIIDHIIDHT